MDLLLTDCSAALTGVSLHLVFFMHGEHHMKAPLYLRLYLSTLGALTWLHWQFCYKSICLSFFISVRLLGLHFTALFASILIYRLFYHQTRSFPGPKLAAASKLWHTWHVLGSQNHLFLDNLRQIYGDFVRTGPNEITVFLPEALEKVNGPASSCTKADWYDFLQPEVAINTTRDKAEHDQRRKLWKPAFLKTALREYGGMVLSYILKLHIEVEKLETKPVEINTLIYWWSFDVMGELAFSTHFNMLKLGKWDSSIQILRDFMALLGPISPVPWLARVGFNLPFVTDQWKRMVTFCRGQMDVRLSMEEFQKDISQPIIDDFRQKGCPEAAKRYLYGDAIAMIIAGSDTIVVAIIFALRYLALDPAHQTRIIDEYKETATGASSLNSSLADKLESCEYLSAFLKETLRLHPPVVTGGPRVTGSEGLVIANRVIPPYTKIITPRYNIARLDTAFSEPDRFIPGRWLTGQDEKNRSHNTTAWMPFGAGKYSCIGREYTMRQLRVFLVLLLLRFEVRLAPGEDGTAVERNMKDMFTAVPGKLNLTFHDRLLSDVRKQN